MLAHTEGTCRRTLQVECEIADPPRVSLVYFLKCIHHRQAWDEMDRLVREGHKVYITAFSNGCILAAAWGLHHPDGMAGITWVSGRGLASHHFAYHVCS